MNSAMARDIQAVKCGDDGIGAHESAQYRVRGLVSNGNLTGICDTGTAETHYAQVLIRDCVGFDLYFPAAGRYRLRGAVVLSSALQPLAVSGLEARSYTLDLENAWIRRASASLEASIGKTGALLAARCTFENLSVHEPTRAALQHCRVHGTPSFSLDAKGT